MSKYRPSFPALARELMLTDGGIETYLMYIDGIELEEFSSFHLLDDPNHRQAIHQYYCNHAEIARRYGVNFILTSLTYRASSDWGDKLGYSKAGLAEMNHKAIALLREVADIYEGPDSKMIIGGCVGPRGDAYSLNLTMSASEAQGYHSVQIQTLKDADVDMINGLTLNNVDEAIGIARAAKALDMPVDIGFSLEQDGRLQTGQPLSEAIMQVDAETDGAPVYFTLNCAHPNDFRSALAHEPWMSRLVGLRANASDMSHGALCKLNYLDDGDPVDLGFQYGMLARNYPDFNMFGGCCGTDHRHLEEICKAVVNVRRA